jgi:uncharacterized protein (TIGR03790 family)
MISLRIKWFASLVVCGLLWPCVGSALGPHELLILANGSQPDSIEVAKAYARLRSVPDSNIIVLRMSAWDPKKSVAISAAEFTRLIWTPAMHAAKARGIDDHILAWAYSTHFPIRIATQPPISLQGLTFVRNHMPTAKAIAEGTYASPLFAGPDGPKGNGYGPQTFDASKQLLREEMPLPSIALGYTGPRGNTKAEVLSCLRTGTFADATRPEGSVYFVTSENIRSRCRQWQFPSSASGLRKAGINAVVGTSFPEGKRDVIGIMMGEPTVKPETVGRFLPGCFAEHLTSTAAMFDLNAQTKLSRWIARGATASAGAVWEPMSIWAKFPNARIFNHYGAGCTLIESFYQSVRCPLQSMLVGEPLAAPWAPEASLSINGIKKGERVKTPCSIGRRLSTKPGVYFNRTIYLVDGLVVGDGSSFELDPARLDPGRHTLRVVAYRTGFVRSQIFEVMTFHTE